MKAKTALAMALFAASAAAAPCSAQSNLVEGDAGGPRAAMERFLALNAASDLAGAEGQALLGGELEGTSRPSLGPLPPPDRIVLLGDGRAAARLPADGERRPDLYIFLERSGQGSWQLTAARSLALTGLLGELRSALRQMSVRTEEEERTLGNVELTLAPDADLRRWFDAHRAEMEQLRELAAARARAGQTGRVETQEAEALVARLRLGFVAIAPDGVVRASVGGLVDNEVGFLHAADPALVPPMDPGDHIWIEPLGGGWYLFKTT